MVVKLDFYLVGEESQKHENQRCARYSVPPSSRPHCERERTEKRHHFKPRVSKQHKQNHKCIYIDFTYIFSMYKNEKHGTLQMKNEM